MVLEEFWVKDKKFMKKIKIPKVDGTLFYPVFIYKSRCRKYTIVLKKQKILDIPIPIYTEMNIAWELLQSNHAGDIVEVPGWVINRLLKFIYIQNLRNGQ